MRYQVSFLKADGAHDISHQLALSGEPLIPDLRDSFQLSDPIGLLEYQDLTLQGLDYESAYSDYWNSTAADDGELPFSALGRAPAERGQSAKTRAHASRSGRRRGYHAGSSARCRHPRAILPHWCVSCPPPSVGVRAVLGA
jgi:hypothetical protein